MSLYVYSFFASANTLICNIDTLSHLTHTSVNSTNLMSMESSKETGCQAREGPILCINNCGFFGSATTMNMCSKCHKDMILNQQQTMLAQTSIQNIVNGGCPSSNPKEPIFAELKIELSQPLSGLASAENLETKAKEGLSRCATCRKRVGLTGFNCKCGSLFCSVHRYADKHECPFDYRSAGRDAIAKANPLVRGDKLDKI